MSRRRWAIAISQRSLTTGSAATISGTRSHFEARSEREAACVWAVGSSCACILRPLDIPEFLPFYVRGNPTSNTKHQDTERRRSCEERCRRSCGRPGLGKLCGHTHWLGGVV